MDFEMEFVVLRGIGETERVLLVAAAIAIATVLAAGLCLFQDLLGIRS